MSNTKKPTDNNNNKNDKTLRFSGNFEAILGQRCTERHLWEKRHITASQRKNSLSDSWVDGSQCRYWPDR